MGFFKRLWLQVQFVFKSLFFLQYLPYAFFYSLKRDRQERRYLPASSSDLAVFPGKLLQATATERGANFEFEQAELTLAFLTPDLICVHWSPGLPPIPYAIAPQMWDAVTPTLEQTDDGWILASEALQIAVDWQGGLTIRDAAGTILRTELPPQRQGEVWQHQAPLSDETRIYGLGERATMFNLRAARDQQQQPKTYRMWNYDPGNIYQPGTDPMYLCIPVYLGLHQQGSYLVFYENTFAGEMTFSDRAIAQFEQGALRYYIAIGKPSRLVERYTQLTGRPELPPRWALGYHQSRWGYLTERNVRQEVQTFQEHDLPISAVHLDIDCQVNHRAFTLDPQRFPCIRQFTEELAKSEVYLVAINNPGIRHSRQSNLFLEGQVLDAFCTYPDGELVVAPVWAGPTVFPDFTNPQVRSWWSQQFAYLLRVGISGFWIDMNEPAAFVAWGDPTLPRVAQHDLEGRGGDHREAHNVYGMLEAKAAHDSLRHHEPQQRPFIVARSGWASLQRYAWTWTGDIVSTWEALRQTIATILGLGLSGIPFSGPDIGGFLGNPNAELYLRWFQMATFFMFYRTHCATNVSPRAPWTYGEPYLSIMRRFMHLRYQLLPYFYTLAWTAAQIGHPPVRPLFWSDAQDASLWDVDDAFCLGEALLIAPVLQAGAISRTVTLPQGQWYSFWDDAIAMGGSPIQVETPLDQIPVWVRAGSVLPMTVDEQLILHLYPPVSGEHESLLYSDAGDGYGESRCDRFRLIRQAEGLELHWEAEGDYAFPYTGVQVQVHGVAVKQAWVDRQEMPVAGQTLSCGTFEQIRFNV